MASKYIVSEDMTVLLARFLRNTFGYTDSFDFTPFRRRLHQALQFGEHALLSLPYDELREGMERLLSEETQPVICVDTVYVAREPILNVTRCCDESRKSIQGVQPRPGCQAVQTQFEQIAASLGGTPDDPVQVTLLDDVVFTGGSLRELQSIAEPAGIQITRVIAGVVIYSFCKETLESLPQGWEAVHCFPNEANPGEVVDEICERDFFVCAPMCGRTMKRTDGIDEGFAYMVPLGDAGKWASFGPHANHVSAELLQINIDLLSVIETHIGREILSDDLPRRQHCLRHPKVNGDRVVDHLRAHRADLLSERDSQTQTHTESTHHL